MKKVGALLLCAMLLASCALPGINDLPPVPTVTPTLPPAALATATETLVPTSTQPTPTFTLTPTLMGFKTATFTDTPVSETPTAAVTDTPDLVIPSQSMDGFALITVSAKEFFLGGCEPSSVKFTAQAANATEAAFVVLFVRMKSTVTETTSPWSNFTMDNMGAGTFTHTLIPDEIKYLNAYEEPWIQYQLVAVNGAHREIGRTQIFDEMLRLKNCAANPTATP